MTSLLQVLQARTSTLHVIQRIKPVWLLIDCAMSKLDAISYMCKMRATCLLPNSLAQLPDGGVSQHAALLLSCQGLSDGFQDDQAVCAAQLNRPLLH